MATILEPKIDRHSAPESSDRSFGFVFATVSACIGGLPLLHNDAPRWWALGASVAFGLAAIVHPQTLHPLNRCWIAFGNLVHRGVSPIVMGAIFFLCVTPIAWIMRWRGNDLLTLRPHPDLKSYWIDKQPSPPHAESMKTQY
jgi:hypothetical protein